MWTIKIYLDLSPSLRQLVMSIIGGQQEVLAALRNMETNRMADAATSLAKITANTDALKAIAAAVDVLDEGQTSIVALIADLKAQIAAGSQPDFGPIDTALDEQAAVIGGLNQAIPAGTPIEPSNL